MLPSQYAPAEVEARRYEHWEKAGYFTPESAQGRPGRAELHDRAAAAERNGHPAHRPRAEPHAERHPRPPPPHAGLPHALAARHGPRRASPPRTWSSASWPRRACPGTTSAARRSSSGSGSGRPSTAAGSCPRCAASATRVDWSRERFTMDEGLSRAVQTIFKRLYDDGLIYRAERIINWCPRCLTALSDIEVDHSDDDGELVSIRYGDGDDSIVVATTRAETMLGDTAVAVHPDDERYAHLVGKTVELPLTGRRHPDRGRRARRPGLRHRRGQGHPGPRPERLRDRPPPRPARARRHGRARRDHRAGAVRGAGPVRGPPGDRRRAARGRPDRQGDPPLRARGRALLPLLHHGRAAAVPAVVRERRRRWPRRRATPCATAGSRSRRRR